MVSKDDITAQQILEIIKNPKQLKAINKSVGKLQPEYNERFKSIFELCDEINGCTTYKSFNQAQTTRKKGQLLELLLKSMFKYTGGLFETYENLGTSTNEIDLFLRVSESAKILLGSIIDIKYKNILCECKNYQDTIGVTYIGKFYSLASVSQKNIAILVSWHGIGGDGWNDGVGLVKKIYMLKERKEDKIYIIDFNKRDFEKVLAGESIISILDKKCLELELDVSFEKYFEKHPNQDELEEKLDSIIADLEV